MVTGPVTLSLDTVLAMVRWRNAEPHPVLCSTPTWHPEEALLALDEHARAELVESDLFSHGRLAPAIDDAIGVLVRADRELYGWVNATLEGRPRRYGVLAASAYREAIVVVRDLDTDVAVLTTVRPADLTRAFLSQLPSVPPGCGESISMPYEAFLTATRDSDEFVGFRARRDPRAEALQNLLAQPRTGAGNLYTATRTTTGIRQRATHPINYIDTPNGRWLTTLTDHANQLTATATPATPETIARALA
jgi:hypothetical protein